jgi:gluconate 2-dehydrogenase alpha chain
VPNVFSFGAAAFPQHITYNYELTFGATKYWALDAIKNKYLKSPGPLVPG